MTAGPTADVLPVPRDATVPVEGGELAVGVYGPEDAARTFLAIHGITASSRAWIALAERLPDARIVAPDLRGRGRSRGLPEPYGLRQHAADLERVLDAFGIERSVVVGHSMGAFVANLLADRVPDRVPELVLVDGGFPLAVPAGMTPERLTDAVLGPVLARLSMTFASEDDYLDFWRRQPAVGPYWTPEFEAYARYDLVPADGGLHSSGNAGAIAPDATSVYPSEWMDAAIEGLGHRGTPVTVFRAPRGLQDAAPLYPEGALEAVRATTVPRLRIVEVEDVNHYTIVMAERGAGLIADAIRAALSRIG